MADPVQVQCSSACTVTLEFTTPMFNIDEAGGGQIAGAIIAVWAVAWAFRMLVRTIKTVDADKGVDED